MRVTRTGPKTLARPRPCPASTVPCGIPAALVTCAMRCSRALSRANVACSSRRCSSRPSSADHLLPLPVVQEPGLARRPGQQPGELLRGAGQRRRQLPVRRGLAPVLPDLPDRPPTTSPSPPRLRCPQGMISAHDPGNGPGTGGPGNAGPSRTRPRKTTGTAVDRHRSPMVMPDMTGTAQTLRISGHSTRHKRKIIPVKKMHPVYGSVPTVIGLPAVLVAVRIGVTVPERESLTT